MNAQSIISHRMFVAALSLDESEATRKRGSKSPPPGASVRGQRARAMTAPGSPRAVARPLLLLSDAVEWQASEA